MKKLMIACVAVAGFAFFNTPQVEAGSGFRFSVNVGHRNFGRHGFRNNYRWGYGRVHSVWHDTSHYDYHPGGYVRHRNHYHYVPGHYDYHRTGHWDTHVHH